MAEIEQITYVFFGWKCDKRDCPAEWLLPEPWHGRGQWRREFRTTAIADGWTFWARRVRRVYCPDHGPSKGSKMWQVKP